MKSSSYIVIIVLTVVINHSSQAQIYVHSGAVVSGINTSNVISSDRIITFTAGAGYRHALHDNFFIRSEINYSKKGYAYANSPSSDEIFFYYLSFPVSITYRPLSFLSVETGIETSHLFDAKFKSTKEYKRIKVLDTYKGLDVGLIAGITLFGQKYLNFYLRYIHGLRNLLEYPEFDNFGNITGEIKDVKNRIFQAGIRLNFGQ